jgi:hypothetical protein
MAAKTVDYKGEKGKLIMVGHKKEVPGWRGELYVAVIEYGQGVHTQYDVIPDSTDPADVDDLPETKTFSNRSKAISHFMNLENNKHHWK